MIGEDMSLMVSMWTKAPKNGLTHGRWLAWIGSLVWTVFKALSEMTNCTHERPLKVEYREGTVCDIYEDKRCPEISLTHGRWAIRGQVHQFGGNNTSGGHCGRCHGFRPITSLHLFNPQSDQPLPGDIEQLWSVVLRISILIHHHLADVHVFVCLCNACVCVSVCLCVSVCVCQCGIMD